MTVEGGRTAAPNSPVWGLWRRPSPDIKHGAHYERVLGTSLEIQLTVDTRKASQAAEAAALEEIDRLEDIFSAYRANSELGLWQQSQDERTPVSPELATVLQSAEDWRRRTENAFHPAVEALTHLWRSGAERGEEPSSDALANVVRELSTPLWDVDKTRRTARRRTRLPVTLNAIAKGYIIDAACQTALRQPGVRAVLVNIGGDIRHIGGKPILAAVADPFAPQDNAPPLATVRLGDQGLATSGGYRRGFQIGERWRSHLLDPRTGYPAEDIASASVIAGSAEMADILTTAFSVMRPDESLRLADNLPGVGVLLVTCERQIYSNSYWKKHSQ
jgi:thiamine biosynthesis lipoprotein